VVAKNNAASTPLGRFDLLPVIGFYVEHFTDKGALESKNTSRGKAVL